MHTFSDSLRKLILECYCFIYRYYTKARDVLHHYSHMPSFHGIHQDCDETVKQLIVQLREQLRNPKVILTSLLILPLLLFALHTLSLILFYCDSFTSTSGFFTLQGCDFIRLLMILTFLTSLFSFNTVHPQTIGRVCWSTASAEGACRWVVWWIPCTVRLIIFLLPCFLSLETFYRRDVWNSAPKIPYWWGRYVWNLINKHWLVGVVIPLFLLLFRMTGKIEKITSIRCKCHEPAYYKNSHYLWNIIFFTRSIWIGVFDS